MRTRRLVGFTLVVFATSLAGSPGHADLFRCKRADGSIVYTDSQATCPGAVVHEPQAGVQHVIKTPSTPTPAKARKIEKMRSTLETDTEKAAEWKAKRPEAEQELAESILEKDALIRFIRVCNQGGRVYMEKENGLRESISCGDVRDKFNSLGSRIEELNAYLDEGLRKECHRAGCLPGWVR